MYSCGTQGSNTRCAPAPFISLPHSFGFCAPDITHGSGTRLTQGRLRFKVPCSRSLYLNK